MFYVFFWTDQCFSQDHADFRYRIVDLTQPFSGDMPIYPGSAKFQLFPQMKLEQGFNMNTFHMAEHSGTHFDSPSHKSNRGKSVGAFRQSELVCPLVVLDVRLQCSLNADYCVEVEDLRRFEAKNGEIPSNCVVVAWTGWSAKWTTPEHYVNLDADGIPHFPGFGPEVTTFLVTERKIRGMGIDTLSTDPGKSKAFLQHKILLESGGFNLENLAPLDSVPETGSFLLVAPLPITGGSGAPAKILALIPL
jgi:kynurenine formamidase